MDLHIITVITFFVALIELNLIIVIFLGTKTYSSRIFVLLVLTHVLWCVTFGVLHGMITDASVAKLLFNITFYEGLAMSIFFFYFTLTYPDDNKPPYWALAVLLIFFVSQYSIYFTEGLIMSSNITSDPNHFGWMWSYGSSKMTFLIPFSLFWTIGLAHLFIKSRKHPTPKTRKHLSFMFWAMLISVIPTSLFSLTLPMFQIHQYNILSPIVGILWVSVLAYSIMKYNQMKVRVVFTEILVLAGVTLLFINIFI